MLYLDYNRNPGCLTCWYLLIVTKKNHSFKSLSSQHLQCQSQLKTLYGGRVKGCNLEFSAYNLLCGPALIDGKVYLLHSKAELVTLYPFPEIFALPLHNSRIYDFVDFVVTWALDASIAFSLPKEAKNDATVKHALEVRSAVSSGNHVLFFKLYKVAPNLNSCLMGKDDLSLRRLHSYLLSFSTVSLSTTHINMSFCCAVGLQTCMQSECVLRL